MVKEDSIKKIKELEELKHKHRMEELEFQRQTEKLKHEWDLERFRIQNAERRRFEEDKYNKIRSIKEMRRYPA